MMNKIAVLVDGGRSERDKLTTIELVSCHLGPLQADIMVVSNKVTTYFNSIHRCLENTTS